VTQVRFRVDETFDIPHRGGLVVLGTVFGPQPTGVPDFVDEQTGARLRLLGIDFPTPRTRRTGQAVFVLDRQDAAYAHAGRTWVLAR
jgi:hypothetical protein